MTKARRLKSSISALFLLIFLALVVGGCSTDGSAPAGQNEPVTGEIQPTEQEISETDILALPALEAATLDGRALRIVATTSIIGDVVSRVAGEQVELTTLMGPGQDPHSYQPAAADLTAVARADAVFVNGWNLEEGLLDDLANIGEGVPIVPVSAGIRPLAFEGHGHEESATQNGPALGQASGHGSADPHVWQDVRHVQQWVENIAASLSALDPAHAALYSANADAYSAELSELDAYIRNQAATIPEAKRILVTNHDSFSYFADAYGFKVLGTIIPGASTLSEATASDLSALVRAMQVDGVCTLFSETTVSDRLGQTVADELTGCDEVQVVKLFTGAIGPTGSAGDSYTGMMRANIEAIVAALQ